MSSPFTRPRPVEDPALRLVVFHHAGGSAAAYFPISRAVPQDWDVLLLDLPGRGKRHTSPPVEDMAHLVELVAEDVLPWAFGAPLALFGHSLGGTVAAEVAHQLEDCGAGPAWVGVSGCAAPADRARARTPDHAVSDEALMAELADMGGLHHRLEELPEFRERFLGLVRSDLRALAGYRPDLGRGPLSVPLTAFGARDDVWAPPPTVAGWARETRAAFTHRVYNGGHFHFLGPRFFSFALEIVREARGYAHPDVPLEPSAVRLTA